MNTKRWLTIGVGTVIIVVSALLIMPARHAATVGDIAKDSVAFQTGLRPFDLVTAFNNKSVRSWEDFLDQLQSSNCQECLIRVKRADQSEQNISLKGSQRQDFLASLTPYWQRPLLAMKSNSPLRIYGLTDGDLVVEIESQKIKTQTQFLEALAKHSATMPLNLTVARGDQQIAVGLPPQPQGYSHESLALEPVHLVLAEVARGIGSDLGLQKNDRLILMQGQGPHSSFNYAKFAQVVKQEKKLRMTVVRGPEVKQLELALDSFPPPDGEGLKSVYLWLNVKPMDGLTRGPKLSILGQPLK